MGILELELIIEFTRVFPEDVYPHFLNKPIWFQQDLAHLLTQIRNFLNITFPNRWIGKIGTIEWPARSPDLIPLLYFLY